SAGTAVWRPNVVGGMRFSLSSRERRRSAERTPLLMSRWGRIAGRPWSARAAGPRVAEQGGGDAQPLGHAERELPGTAVRGLLQAGDGEHLLDPPPADRVAGSQRDQVGAGGAARVERLGL